MIERSRRANEPEREQKVFSKGRVEDQVKPIETIKFSKSVRVSETEREQKIFRREE